MSEEYLNCWEIKKCGREKGGRNESKNGECPASKMNMGHSCWFVAGSISDGVKEEGVNCTVCEVFELYSRTGKLKGLNIQIKFPKEEEMYNKLMYDRYKKKHNT
jgi:hypothetical protein